MTHWKPSRGARDAIHGDQVAYGLLVQLAFEEREDAFLADFFAFYRSIGLPVRLAELGMANPTDDEVAELARLTMTAPHLANVRPAASPEGIARAMYRIERVAALTG
jgi:glycerol dehydrogenase